MLKNKSLTSNEKQLLSSKFKIDDEPQVLKLKLTNKGGNMTFEFSNMEEREKK